MEHSYQILLAEIKATIQAERTKAARQITRSLIDAYWEIGKKFLKAKKYMHGEKVLLSSCRKTYSVIFPERKDSRPETCGICDVCTKHITNSQICDKLSQKYLGAIIWLSSIK